MSRHSKRSVRILNPVDGGASYTTRRAARRYDAQGRIDWVDENTIRFRILDHRNQAAASAAARPHSPDIEVIQQLIGRYRNEVLGLPNFVGFLRDKATHGKRKAA